MIRTQTHDLVMELYEAKQKGKDVLADSVDRLFESLIEELQILDAMVVQAHEVIQRYHDLIGMEEGKTGLDAVAEFARERRDALARKRIAADHPQLPNLTDLFEEMYPNLPTQVHERMALRLIEALGPEFIDGFVDTISEACETQHSVGEPNG